MDFFYNLATGLALLAGAMAIVTAFFRGFEYLTGHRRAKPFDRAIGLVCAMLLVAFLAAMLLLVLAGIGHEFRDAIS